jgi:Gluconate 2-dehydrogenase subunit 3
VLPSITYAFPFSANERYGQHVHRPMDAEPQDAKPGASIEPRFFTLTQLLVVSLLTDLIMPPTDTSAAATGVPQYIDLVVNEDPKRQTTFREGLQSLDKISQARFGGTTFLQLSEAQQVEILASLNEAAEQKKPENIAEGDAGFFHAIKGLTADGYCISRIGLLQELGYNGDYVHMPFPVFTILEH